MNEIVPGVFHWKEKHPNIGADVSCYYLLDERVLIDPMQPAEGLDWFREHGEPEHILLSNRHHYRDSGKFVETFGCTVYASRPGMHEFSDDQPVQPFDFGEELPGGVKAYEAGAICPDDTALYIPAHSALSVADGAHQLRRSRLRPRGAPGRRHRGDEARDPRVIRPDSGRVEFDNLLVAHGEPIVGGAGDPAAGVRRGLAPVGRHGGTDAVRAGRGAMEDVGVELDRRLAVGPDCDQAGGALDPLERSANRVRQRLSAVPHGGGDLVRGHGAHDRLAVAAGRHGARVVGRVEPGARQRRIAHSALQLVLDAARRGRRRQVAVAVQGDRADRVAEAELRIAVRDPMPRRVYPLDSLAIGQCLSSGRDEQDVLSATP